jgi:hypothetical protein
MKQRIEVKTLLRKGSSCPEGATKPLMPSAAQEDRIPAAIIISGERQSVTLRSPAAWRKAVRNLDLKPSTLVAALFSDGGTLQCRGADLAVLLPIFAELGIPLDDSAEPKNGVSAQAKLPLPLPTAPPPHKAAAPAPARAAKPSFPTPSPKAGAAVSAASKPQASSKSSTNAPPRPPAPTKQVVEAELQKDELLTPARVLSGLAVIVAISLLGQCLNSSDPVQTPPMTYSRSAPQLTAEKAQPVAQEDPLRPPGSGEIVTAYVRRLVNVRSDVSGRGAFSARLERGAEVTGQWVTAPDGDRWLKVDQGPHSGSYVWGPNLATTPPPEAEMVDPTLLQLVQAADLKAEPRDEAPTVASKLAGSKLTVLGVTAAGWVEIGLEEGGVAYAPATSFQAETPPSDQPQPQAAVENDLPAGPPEPIDASGATSSTQVSAGGACWRYNGRSWRKISEGGSLNTCVQALFAGRCERAGSASFGRWSNQTLRLVAGRVERSYDNRSFRTLVSQPPGDCSIPPIGE